MFNYEFVIGMTCYIDRIAVPGSPDLVYTSSSDANRHQETTLQQIAFTIKDSKNYSGVLDTALPSMCRPILQLTAVPSTLKFEGLVIVVTALLKEDFAKLM